ncbi:hypothetical protein HYS50_03240 [Candidatus Woesearchaeota archaeon]|nr:hypothetical protein [Candidatus Woesearchaeota archaeon]
MGLLYKLFKLKLYVLAFGAGYLFHGCVSNDLRYRIKRSAGKKYLVDTYNNKGLEINQETFQVGSPEYRLRGLLEEPDLQQIVEQAQHERGVKK